MISLGIHIRTRTECNPADTAGIATIDMTGDGERLNLFFESPLHRRHWLEELLAMTDPNTGAALPPTEES